MIDSAEVWLPFGLGDDGARPALIAGGRAPLVGLGVETPVIA